MSLLSAVVSAQGNAALLPIALAFGLAITCLAALLDRYRRSVKIEFKFEGLAGNVTTALLGSFDDLKQCKSVWNVTSEGRTSDWKRNAGATALNERSEIRPALGKPGCIRSGANFPNLTVGKTDLYFFPDGVLVVTRMSVTALAYHDITVSSRAVRFIEDGRVPSDTTIVDQTWRYVNKAGGPDRRFSSNRQLPICRYGEIDFQSDGGLNARIQYSNAEAGNRLVKVIELLRKLEAAKEMVGSAISYRTPRTAPTALYCGVLLLGASLLVLPALVSTQDRVAETPSQNASGQAPTPSAPLPRPRPMGGPLVEGTTSKQPTKTPRLDVPSAPAAGQPMSINPLDSHPAPRIRP